MALVGVIAPVPMIVAGLYGGMLADAFDRRLVALVSSIIAWVAVALIATHAWLDLHSVLLLYVLATVNAVAATVSNASRSAIVPRLVGTDLLPAASALGGIASGVSGHRGTGDRRRAHRDRRVRADVHDRRRAVHVRVPRGCSRCRGWLPTTTRCGRGSACSSRVRGSCGGRATSR
ncbi:MFS transporter [Curtobacterium flaccumfaciens]|nr:MFS transporter [Curtobacterium flaccumfaciens]